MFVGICNVEFVFRIEIVVDLEIDLVAVDIVFQSLLAADEAVSVADPAEDCRIQTVTSVIEVVRQWHSGKYALHVTGWIKAGTKLIDIEDADGLQVAGRGSGPDRIAETIH